MWSRLIVVVWKALLVVSTMCVFLCPRRRVSPLTAAAPLILPILIITSMNGLLRGVAKLRGWVRGVSTCITLWCSVCARVIVLANLCVVTWWWKLLISDAAVVMLILVASSMALSLLSSVLLSPGPFENSVVRLCLSVPLCSCLC